MPPLPLFCLTATFSAYRKVQALVYRSDTVNKKESAGSAAAVGSIDCGSREACSIEDRRRLPRRVPPFFSEQAYDQHSKQKCEDRH